MTSNSIIQDSDISCVALRLDNIDEFAPLLDSFHSRDISINKSVSSRSAYFHAKGEKYDNRDTIYLYVYEDPLTGERSIIGYISCAASSLSVNKNKQKVVIPCVVINTFAINEIFSSKTGVKISNGQSEFKCSLYVLYHFLELMNNFSYKLGITHVYLFAQQNKKVVDFYVNECKFTQISAGTNVLGPVDAREYTYIYSLKNGRYRFV